MTSIVDKAKAVIESGGSLEAVELAGIILMTLTRLKVMLAAAHASGNHPEDGQLNFVFLRDELGKLIATFE